MMRADALLSAAESLPSNYAGPGGVLAVVKDGAVIVQKAWGYADATAGRIMTPETLLPICSITKQFTCALLLDLFPDPEFLADRLRQFLPNLKSAGPSISQLCNNQSGVRDYATTTILCGLGAEDRFDRDQARALLARTSSTYFRPGTEYGYSNSNFHIIACLIEEATGEDYGTLLRERLFNPAGMTTARFVPDSTIYPETCTGYEGDFRNGFFPAVNRSQWIGDAGICASLKDMIRWEQYVQELDHHQGSLYRKISTPQSFADGTPAPYGFGLARGNVCGASVVGHSGGMRGWRMHRTYAREAGLSSIVMFNHEADAKAAAESLIAAALKAEDETEEPSHFFLNRDRAILVEVTSRVGDEISVLSEGEITTVKLDGEGVSEGKGYVFESEGRVLQIARPAVEPHLRFERGERSTDRALEGRFYSEELGSTFVAKATSGVSYGAFDGAFGAGALFALKPVAKDVWQSQNLRGIDMAPGPLTVIRETTSKGAVVVRVSAPLAQNIVFEQIP
ncbi:D-aminopeptidase [Mesorhizobium sp. M7A.F.Ca.US.006.01.1.1]|uniref:D-aminopeptidase n=1 Tax=Mesorhizobium sp. M7A.F.Ca.US.006.01.1.1 TaxID=2496707 RepID=UPI0013E38402|nr:D-aminopeptidase [Mesorhizobium sp. M7A.F.Ca.US.006.01.1.1]